jgi:DNA replication protein DnaC
VGQLNKKRSPSRVEVLIIDELGFVPFERARP